jgi:hypothetical protein
MRSKHGPGGEQRFFCRKEDCTKSYTRVESLRNHIATRHYERDAEVDVIFAKNTLQPNPASRSILLLKNK